MDFDRRKEEFNMAVSELSRINIWCFSVEEAMIKLDIWNWFIGLQVLSAILARHMDKKKGEAGLFDKRFNELWPKVNTVVSYQQTKGNVRIPPELYTQLKNLYVDLRDVANEAGILGREVEDDID